MNKKRLQGTPEDWIVWLTSSDERKWKKARLTMGGLEPTDDVPVDPLINALQSEQDEIVFWCAIALERLQHRASSALPALVQIASNHRQFGIRETAVWALAKIDPADQSVKMAIFDALKDSSSSVRRAALQASIDIYDLSDNDLTHIQAMSSDADEDVARWSEIALRNIDWKRKQK